MHKNKKIIICKFNLKNKCKLGEKCKFKHLNINELNEILNKFEGLKQEYESLKKNFKENGEKLSNLDKKLCEVTDNNINTFSKPLYSSFFKENKHLNDLNAKFFQKNNIKEIETLQIKSVKADKEIQRLHKIYDELLEKRKTTDKELYEKVNSHAAQIETQGEFNKIVEKNLNKLSCEIKCIALATSMYVIDKEN
jgi:isochorismate synthase EntC